MCEIYADGGNFCQADDCMYVWMCIFYIMCAILVACQIVLKSKKSCVLLHMHGHSD